MNPLEKKKDPIQSVSDVEWDALSRTRIYFGHQSVGTNIIDGMKEVAQTERKIQLNIVDEGSQAINEASGFFHGPIGKNGVPESKLESFESNVTRGQKYNIVMMKFCFVDINDKTDLKDLLIRYNKHVESIREKVPGIRIVHFTVPLTSNHPNWKYPIKKLLSIKDPWLEANARRNKYNSMLIREYSGKDPIFDLATIESTLPNGQQMEFKYGEESVKYLDPQYTSDGDHLNETGRRTVSSAFLAFLAKLSIAK